MKNRSILYKETSSIPLNVFLIFYIYIFFVLIIANVLPVLPVTYFLFLAFGITGICILLVKCRYHILVKENTVMLSIKILFRIPLLELKIKEIQSFEKVTPDPFTYHDYGIKKVAPEYTAYLFDTGNRIKFTMSSGEIFVISCTDADGIVTCIKLLKEKSIPR